MAEGIESEGPSADSALVFDDEGTDFDPTSSSDDNGKLSGVWERSDQLRDLLKPRLPLKGGDTPDDKAARGFLRAELVRQLPTISLYWYMHVFRRKVKKNVAQGKTLSLYVLLFPGEARDKTGIKDLNDNVLGQWYNSQFIQKRYDAIMAIFGTDGFVVTAQSYKTAFIETDENARKDFVAKLALLDDRMRTDLRDTLKDARDDLEKRQNPNKPRDSTTEKQKAEIDKLYKKLEKKGYRFDIFFGLRTLKPGNESNLATVYLLVTETLKGAALARYVAKARNLDTRLGRQIAAGAFIRPDAKKLDPRGKEYDPAVYMRASEIAEKIKAVFVKGYTRDVPYVLNEIYVNTVWTLAFMKRKNLYWGNPDTIRDVRKKKLDAAPLRQGNLHYSIALQKNFLELWLVILNMLDFVKGFESYEFTRELQSYHDRALQSFIQLGRASSEIDYDNLEYVLTHDVRQTDPIAQSGSASEYLFYSTAADYRERIFFSMDIRDMGVELMLDYEHSNREIGYHKYSDIDLMEETFRATDPTDMRRRFTYDGVLEVFRKYYQQAAKTSNSALTAAQRAFGVRVDGKLGSFNESVQIMLGGDEIYVAAHPLFTRYVPRIIGDLDKLLIDRTYSLPNPTAYQNRKLDMRASVAFSTAVKADSAKQRKKNQLSHQEAMKLAELAPGTLKSLERTQRRIERLIDVIEANREKAARAPGYRKELSDLPLKQLFARVKYKASQQLPRDDFIKLYTALLAEDLHAAKKIEEFDLVDFTGEVVNAKKLEKDAATLEDKVRGDVGSDNVRVQPPPIHKIPIPLPKWVDELIDIWA